MTTPNTTEEEKRMKKNYIVKIIATAHVLVVGAESEKDALDFANSECRLGDMDFEEASVDREVSDDDLEEEKRNATCVSLPDEDK